MHTASRRVFRDGQDVCGMCESEGDGRQFKGRTRIFVCTRGGVSDVESTQQDSRGMNGVVPVGGMVYSRCEERVGIDCRPGVNKVYRTKRNRG